MVAFTTPTFRHALLLVSGTILVGGTPRDEVAPILPEDLVFMDETGCHVGGTPTHAGAPLGQRAYATATANRSENKTVVATLTLDDVGR